MAPSSWDCSLSINRTSRAYARIEGEGMYSDGFAVAIVIGLLALLSPMLWIGWWLVADLGERVNVTYKESAEPELRRAA